MQKFLRENGLTIVLLSMFLVFVIGQSIAGYLNYNEQQQDHKQAEISYAQYLTTGDFVEALGENWESEFLQMGFYVVLTAFLFQKGSSESKDPDGNEAVDADPKKARKAPEMPWAVRRGGWALGIYQNSLAIVLFVLFFLSVAIHVIGGAGAYCHEQTLHGQACGSTLGYLLTSQFWFESLQNWQSEFFSMGIFMLLTVFLRQKGSPESKPVASSHSKTGES